MRYISLLGVFLFLFFSSTNLVKAVTITINNFPSTISSTDPFQVGVTISGATNATNYLRVDLYKEGTVNYFGETYNGTDWYNGSDGKIYFPIQIQNASASATITSQIGNPSSTDYTGPGTYKLKIRRYTSSGSASSNDIQTPADIQFIYSVPTPTPSPTSVPTNVPTSSPTPIKTSSPIPTKSPTPKPTLSLFPTDSPQAEVLGLSISETSIPDPTPIQEESDNKPPVLAFIFIGLGIVLICVSILYTIKHVKKNSSSN